MISWYNRKLLKKLDTMLDSALTGTFEAQSYDEKLLSKIEFKMAQFLEQSKLRREHIEGEQERVRALISDISHQTKTPIANITLYTGLLSEQNLTPEQARLAAQISESTEKLDFLIQTLVKTSRLENGIISIKPTPGNVREIIDAAVSECVSLAAAKHIKLILEQNDNNNLTLVPDANNLTPEQDGNGNPVTALIDIHWCTEALFNIIENAIKYTPENGHISVTVTEYEMFIRIDIEDTGRGIREEDLPKIFGRFWRAAESADSPGVGIGLYLTREIITACGGYIKVASQYGKGSVFSVFLSKV